MEAASGRRSAAAYLSAWLDAPVFPGADQFWMSLPKVAGEEMFLRGEKDYLRPLPLKRYVMKEKKLMTVGRNSYV